MSLREYIKQGATAAELDITQYAPLLKGLDVPLLSVGMRYGSGQASQSTLEIDRPASGPPPYIFSPSYAAGRRLVRVTEDVTGCERWLFVGRVIRDGNRRGIAIGNQAGEQTVTAEDANAELRGLPFTEIWSRPAETAYDRLVALQAYILNGAASTAPHHRDSTQIVVTDSHLCKNANNFTMPAADYPARTTPEDVVRDCATTEGKDFAVVLHAGGFPEGNVATILHSDANATFNDAIDLVVASGLSDSALIIFVSTFGTTSGVLYEPDPIGAPGSGTAMTFIASDNTYGVEVSAWVLVNPSPTTGASAASSVHATVVGGSANVGVAVYLLQNVDQTTPIADSGAAATAANGGPTVSVSGLAGTGLLSLSAVGFSERWDAPCGGGGGDSPATLDHTALGISSFGLPGCSIQSSHASNVTSMGWHGLPDTSCGAAPNWPFAGSSMVAVSINAATSSNGDCDHLCLQYIVPSDLSTNPCVAKISDEMADYDPLNATNPVFFPIPIGDYTTGENQDMASAAFYEYQTPTGSGSTFIEDTTATSTHDYWGAAFQDNESLTPTQALQRADEYLLSVVNVLITHSVAIIVRPEQVHLIRAGMAIGLKGRSIVTDLAAGTYAYQTRRIAQVQVTTIKDKEAGYLYRIELELDRPSRLVPQPSAYGPNPGDASRATVTDPSTGTTSTVQGAIDNIAPTTIKSLLNKSGASVAAGDVVVVDTANNDAFTTTTTAAETRLVGVALATIGNGAAGPVAIEGYVALVNTTGSVTRGDYGFTSTTVKKASNSASRSAGAFCQFLKGGTTPDGILFGVPDSAAAGTTFGTPAIALGTAAANGSINEAIRRDATIIAFDGTAPSTQAVGDAAATGSAAVAARRDHKHAISNPLTTQDDLWVAGASGAPGRLPKGSDGQVLTVDPVTHHLVWATPSGGGTFGTPAIVLGTAAAAGSIDEVIRRDATIVAFDATNPVTQAIGDSAATGSQAVASRRDHKHGMPGFGGTGSSSNVAHSDHTHTGGGGSSALYYLDTIALSGTYGDEFDGSSLSGIWTRRNLTSGNETYQDGGGSWLRVDLSGGSTDKQYHQTAPGGDFEIILAFADHDANGNHMLGPMIIDSTGAGVACSLYANSLGLYMWTLASYVYSSTAAGALGLATAGYTEARKVWLSLKKVGTTYTARYSHNGFVWTPTLSVTSSITVNRIGFGRMFSADSGHTLAVDRFNVV